MTERENMPEISSAAMNTLSKSHENIKHPATSEPKEIIIATCKNCNKTFNKSSADKILSTLPILPNFDYEELCLTCIKEDSQQIKESVHPVLVQLREEQDEMNRLYQESYNRWKKVSNEYKALDYQTNMINHHLTKPVKKAKTTTPKKEKTSGQLQKAMAMKILASLSPEQRAAVEANLAKQ